MARSYDRIRSSNWVGLMADGTAIQWTEATWNPLTGCSVVSPGCTNCYAMKLAGTRLHRHQSRAGLTVQTKAGPVWTGEVRFNEQWLDQPLRWRRPRRIFVCAHSDLFHENAKREWVDRIFAVMALARHHTFQVLTKRPHLAREYLTDVDFPMRVGAVLEELKPSNLWNGNAYEAQRALGRGILPNNVWLGTSVEDQKRADVRIPELLETPAAVRWLSCEPLLGPVDVTPWLRSDPFVVDDTCDECGERHHGRCDQRFVDWVVVGCESGPGARPFDNGWARAILAQCRTGGADFFCKQLPMPGRTTRVLHDLEDFPEDLRVRQYPERAG
jgi:protein gp37